MRDSLVIYTSYLEKFDALTDEQFGMLARGLIEYQKTDKEPTFTGKMVAMAFKIAKFDLDANNEKWETVKEIRRAAGAKGGRQKQINRSKSKQKVANVANASFANETVANDSKSKQGVANVAVNVNVNGNDNVSANALNNTRERVREEMLNAFRAFWELYPRKEKEDAAARIWISLKPDADLVKTIMDSLKINLEKNGSWKRDGGRYIPIAEKWLLERRWKDEVREEKEDKKPSNQFHDFEQRSYTEKDYSDLEKRLLQRGLA